MQFILHRFQSQKANNKAIHRDGGMRQKNVVNIFIAQLLNTILFAANAALECVSRAKMEKETKINRWFPQPVIYRSCRCIREHKQLKRTGTGQGGERDKNLDFANSNAVLCSVGIGTRSAYVFISFERNNNNNQQPFDLKYSHRR